MRTKYAAHIPRLWRQLAQQFGAAVHQVTPQTEYSPHEWYFNYSYVYLDSGEIQLGYFENEEVRELFLFHELGHMQIEWLDENKVRTLYEEEDEAWQRGLALAQKNGVCFSPDTLTWVDYALSTYRAAEKQQVTQGLR